MQQRDTFDAVAELYARARPGYVADLYDDLERLAGLGPDARVLEVGCGAGQATADLAARARDVVALDPGQNLIDAAKRQASAANITYVNSRFEDYEPPHEPFDLVASAQAWHWVEPHVGYAKAAGALSNRGAIAVFGHVPCAPEGRIGEAFKRIYETHAPGLWSVPPSQSWYLPSGPVASMIRDSGRFGTIEHRRYDWVWQQDPATLGAFLRTDSSLHFLAEPARFAFIDALSAAVEASGGILEARWETHLYVSRVR